MSQALKSLCVPLLALSSAVCIAAWCWLLFQAGCAGDLKTGIYGDPLRALEFERAAVPFLFLSFVAGVASIASLRPIELLQRVLWAVGLVFFGLPAAWLFGPQFEGWGVQSFLQP